MRSHTQSGLNSKPPYFKPSQIDQICADELRKADLLPSSPTAVRIDRFIEKRFGASPQYEDLPQGVLGFTKFNKNGVEAIVISAALDAQGGKVAQRRVRTTLAHEAGHGLLHAYLFALKDKPLHLFDKDSHTEHQILCRDVPDEEQKSRRYDSRGWEFQANRAMGGLLCPRALVNEAITTFLVPSGMLGLEILDEKRREEAVRVLADIFNVNPVVARIRTSELYPAETGQLRL